MSDSPRNPTLIGSVQRALRLLDTVGSSSSPVTAKQLARQTGLAMPTTYHLLRTLVHEGYLHKLSEGYVLGERVNALQTRSTPQTTVAHLSPTLHRLRDELSAAVYLASFDDGEIVLMDVADGPKTPRVDLWADFRDAAHATAIGKSLLSSVDAETQRDYLSRHPLVGLTPRTITDKWRLMHTLPSAGEVAVDEGEYSLNTACIAAPLCTPNLVGTLAVSVPEYRFDSVMNMRTRLASAAQSAALTLTI